MLTGTAYQAPAIVWVPCEYCDTEVNKDFVNYHNWMNHKEEIMAKREKPVGRIKAEDLHAGIRIVDPEGNAATVRRYQWIDHQRGRLSTDLGVAVVEHSTRFPVLPPKAS
jgi:hypothetical protein